MYGGVSSRTNFVTPLMTGNGKGFRSPLTIYSPLLICLLGVLIYSNTFSVPMEMDDYMYLPKYLAIKDFRYFTDPSLAARAIQQNRLNVNFQTRKVVYLSFALNYRFDGLRVQGFHILNLLIHLVNALLVYLLVICSLRTPVFRGWNAGGCGGRAGPAALFAALLFVAHPVQTQAVTYICQRFASLATMFYLLSLVLFVIWRLSGIDRQAGEGLGSQLLNCARVRRAALYIGSILSALLAIFSKEISFTLPLVVIMYELMFFDRKNRKWRYLLPFVAILPIIPMIIFADKAGYEDVAKFTASFAGDGKQGQVLVYFFTQFRVIVTYLRLLVLPVGQNIDYDYPEYSSLFDLPVFVSFILLSLIIGSAIFAYRRSLNKTSACSCWYRLMSFGIFWFFLTLSVESSVIPLRDVIFEHRLYLPSVGFFLWFLSLVQIILYRYSLRKSKAILGIMVVLICAMAGATYARNSLWTDSIALWEDTVRKSPEKSRPHNILAVEYERAGRYEEAIDHFKRGILFSSDPLESLNAYRGLSRIYKLKSNQQQLRKTHEDCLEMLLQALQREKGNLVLLNETALQYAAIGRWREAESLFQRAIKIDADSALSHFNLGSLYFSLNRVDAAENSMRQAVRLDPDNDIVQAALGDILAARGLKNKEAMDAYMKAKKLNPDVWSTEH